MNFLLPNCHAVEAVISTSIYEQGGSDCIFPFEAVWKSNNHTHKEEAHMEGHPGFIYSPAFILLERHCLPSLPGCHQHWWLA